MHFSSFYHPFLLILFTLIPLICLVKKNDKILIAWLAISAMIDIFSSQIFFNLSSFKIAGIVLIPWALKELPSLYKTPMGKIIVWYCIYLIISFLYFGIISPWPNHETVSALQDSQLGRGLRQLGTQLTEMAIVIFLGKALLDEALQRFTLKAIIFSTLFAALGIILEKLFAFDFFYFVTEGRPLLLAHRARGFNYEPRAAAQTCVYGLLLLCIYQGNKQPIKTLMALALSIGFLFSISMTASVLLVAGITTTLFCLTLATLLKKVPFNYSFIITLAVTAIIALIVVKFGGTESTLGKQTNAIIDNHAERSYVLNSDSLVGRFEVFDAAALNVYLHNPQYIFFGVGTGQMSFLSTHYTVPRDHMWTGQIKWLPTMGAVLQLANGGLITLSLFILLTLLGAKTLWNQLSQTSSRLQLDIFISFMVIMSLYYLQVRFIHPFALGLALAASYNLNSQRPTQT